MSLTRLEVRQIVRFAKEIIARLGRVHDALLDTQKVQIDAVAKYAEAQEKSNEPSAPQPIQVAPVEVHFPPEERDRHSAEQHKAYRLQLLTFALGAVTLLTLVIYTSLTYKQWQALEGQLKAMQRQTEISERPWLSLEASIAG